MRTLSSWGPCAEVCIMCIVVRSSRAGLSYTHKYSATSHLFFRSFARTGSPLKSALALLPPQPQLLLPLLTLHTINPLQPTTTHYNPLQPTTIHHNQPPHYSSLSPTSTSLDHPQITTIHYHPQWVSSLASPLASRRNPSDRHPALGWLSPATILSQSG